MRSKFIKGFTFIEVLIVVAIIAGSLTLFLGNYVEQGKKNRDGQRKADFHKIRVALEDYNNDNSCYPPQNLMNCNPGDGMKPYLPKVPCDPKTNLSYSYVPESSSCPSYYWLYAQLEHKTDPDIEASGCSGGCGPGNAYNFKLGSPNAQ